MVAGDLQLGVVELGEGRDHRPQEGLTELPPGEAEGGGGEGKGEGCGGGAGGAGGGPVEGPEEGVEGVGDDEGLPVPHPHVLPLVQAGGEQEDHWAQGAQGVGAWNAAIKWTLGNCPVHCVTSVGSMGGGEGAEVPSIQELAQPGIQAS